MKREMLPGTVPPDLLLVIDTLLLQQEVRLKV